MENTAGKKQFQKNTRKKNFKKKQKIVRWVANTNKMVNMNPNVLESK